MSSYLVRPFIGAALWGLGDTLAQMYVAHKEAALRRARGEKRKGARPSSGDMFNMLDKETLVQSAVFGAVAEPMLFHYRVISPRVFGALSRSVPACCGALAMQQLLITPALLWLYFNSMTGARNGFSDMWYMEAHLPQQRHDVAAVEKYIVGSVLSFPLLTSWAVYTPFYIAAYFGPFRGLSLLHYTMLLPWVASVSYTQRSALL